MVSLRLKPQLAMRRILSAQGTYNYVLLQYQVSSEIYGGFFYSGITLRSRRFQLNSSNRLSNILFQCKAMGFLVYIPDTIQKNLEIFRVLPTDCLDAVLFVPVITMIADHLFGSLSLAMSTQCSRSSCRIDRVRLGFM